MPGIDKGPQHSTSADFTNVFMPKAKKAAEIVQLVIIPLSRLYQSEVVDLVTLI